MKNPKYEVFKSTANGQYYFHLTAANGEKILSGEGYTTRQHCMLGIASVVVNAKACGRFERHDAYFSYTFNLKAANGEIIGRSENYVSEAGRERGIAAVKQHCTADVVYRD